MSVSPINRNSFSLDKIEEEPNPTQFADVLSRVQPGLHQKQGESRGVKKTLDKDDFLRFMIEQMKHQDPTNPFKPEDMGAHIAQLSMVEQLTNLNQMLQKSLQSNPQADNIQLSVLIGKKVTVDDSFFSHQLGAMDKLSFELPVDAKECVLSIIDERGQLVAQKSLLKALKGVHTVQWDGKDLEQKLAQPGAYRFVVSATNIFDQPIDINHRFTGWVQGLHFENKKPVLLVQQGQVQKKIFVDQMISVEQNDHE